MPSSTAKIEVARANGSKSTGPKTEKGKRAVALNAVKHGLTARTVVLENESEQEYQAELRDYLEHFRPQGKPEIHLVHQLAAAHWRMARYAGVESGLLEHEMDDQAEKIQKHFPDLPEEHRLAIAFESLSGGSSLALLNRYQSRLHHEYQRVLKSLLQLQTARRAEEAKLRNKPTAPKVISPPPETKPANHPPNESTIQETNVQTDLSSPASQKPAFSGFT